jgi:hypothetical protein
MNGLFSNNPEMTRAMNYGTNLAGVPSGRVGLALTPVMGQMAQQATGGLLSGLGVESPEVKKERALQAILGGINPQDANSLADASRKLMGMGMTTEAQAMMEEARKVAESSSKVGLQTAQTYQAGASAQKDLTQAKVYAKEAAIKGYPPRTTALIAQGADEATVAKSLASELQIDEDAALAKIAKDKADVSTSFMNAQTNRMNAETNQVNAESLKGYRASGGSSGGKPTADIQNAQRLAELETKEVDGTLTPIETNELKNYRTGKLTTVGEKAVNENVTAYDDINKAMAGFDAAANSMVGLMNSNVKWKSGALRSMAEYMKEIAGTEDAATLANLRTEATQIEKQLAALPRGPASDKDMAVAARVRLGQYANPQALLDDVNYMKEAAQRVREGVLFKDEYLAKNKNLNGFVAAYEKKFSGQSTKSGVTSTGVKFRIKE